MRIEGQLDTGSSLKFPGRRQVRPRGRRRSGTAGRTRRRDRPRRRATSCSADAPTSAPGGCCKNPMRRVSGDEVTRLIPTPSVPVHRRPQTCTGRRWFALESAREETATPPHRTVPTSHLRTPRRPADTRRQTLHTWFFPFRTRWLTMLPCCPHSCSSSTSTKSDGTFLNRSLFRWKDKSHRRWTTRDLGVAVLTEEEEEICRGTSRSSVPLQ